MTTVTGIPGDRLAQSANHRFDDNGRKARYGVAYLQSLCAHAGVDFKEGSLDSDNLAVDATIEYPRMPVRVQIKCTSKYKVGNGNMTLELKPEWVAKWAESDTTVFVVVVKVPADIPSWLEHDPSFTRHCTVAFGQRFNASIHTKSMKFTASDKITSETVYDWRDLAYAIADGATL